MKLNIKKASLADTTPKEEWQQILYAEVYPPNIVDTHGDYMTAKTIETMAHNFLREGNQTQIDVMHDSINIKACVVESFIARKNDPDFIEGAWVVAIHVEDKDVWQKILNRELNGLSLEAWAVQNPKKVTINIPNVVSGKTSITDGHQHNFIAKYDKKGNFIGGLTDEVDGHQHYITAATLTDETLNHAHTFDSVDDFYIIDSEPPID